MAKSKKQKGKNYEGKLFNIFIPVSIIGMAVLTAIVVVINPFNIVKIMKNNYPELKI